MHIRKIVAPVVAALVAITATAVSGTASVVNAAGEFAGQTPERLIDTRPNHMIGPFGVQRDGSTVRIRVGAHPVALNLTAVGPTAPGHMAAYPCAEGAPDTSSINFEPSTPVVANMALVAPDDNGDVCVRTTVPQGQVHLVVDKTGSFTPAAGFTGMAPERLADQRVGAGRTLTVSGLSPNAGAVLNLTTAAQSAPGHLTAFPCEESAPNASVSNYVATPKANMTVVKADSRGRVCVRTHSATRLVVDQFGTIAAGNTSEFVTPSRLLDSRPAQGGDGTRRTYNIAIPNHQSRAVVLNVTAVADGRDGHFTVFLCGSSVPMASTVNFGASGAVPNHVVIQPSSSGRVCIDNRYGAHAIVDLMGYVGAPSTGPPTPPVDPVAGEPCQSPHMTDPTSSEIANAQASLAGITIEPEVRDGYDRARFPHWRVVGELINARHEVLRIQSVIEPEIDNRRVIGGMWCDPFGKVEGELGVWMDDPSAIDIDHIVALAEAWDSGAREWTDDQRREFANDIVHWQGDGGLQLAAVDAGENRSKGDKDPAEWIPSNPYVRCSYLVNWTLIKDTWDLSMDSAEHASVNSGLNTCASSVIPDRP